MPTLLTADGRLLRSAAPALASQARQQGLWPSAFPPMWSDGSREPNGLTDGLDAPLVSYEAIYRSQPVVAAVVDKLARRIATLPFDAYRRNTDGARELLRGDTLDSLIRRPLPRQSTVHLNHHIAQSLLLHGNALVAKVYSAEPDTPPMQLWPLDWSKISAYAPTGGRIEWWSTTQFTELDDGSPRYIKAEDTLHFAWAAPSGLEIGVSPLEKLGVTLKIEDAAQRHQTASFRNGSRPSLVVSVEGDLDTDQREFIEQSIAGLHRIGPDNAAKTLLLAGGAKAEKMSLTPVEAELIEQRKLGREEIGMVYDLAGPLMNDLTHGTYSNVAELTKGLYRDVVPPWTELIVQTYQAQLLDPEPAWLDRFLAFDFADKMKGEPRELAETLKLEVEAGLITRNEARRILNLAPFDDAAADIPTLNANNQRPIGAVTTSDPAGA